jgi:hypothetical protein
VPDNSFSDEFFDRWEHLISDLEISDVPIRFIKAVSATFKDGQSHVFDINTILSKGIDFPEIEVMIEDYLEVFSDDIECVDFHLNVSAIAEEVEGKTNRLLD